MVYVKKKKKIRACVQVSTFGYEITKPFPPITHFHAFRIYLITLEATPGS